MIDYITSNVWQLWVFIAVVSLIIELSSGGFFILCFAIGAAVSAIVAALGGGIILQIVIFAVASALCIFLVRPVVLKYLPGHKHATRASNADALIGQTGVVSEKIEAGGFGRVAIYGDDWKAESIDGGDIPKATKVKVVNRESIIITVQKI